MSTCAVCQLSDGLVINLIIAEPTDQCPVDGCQLVLVPEGLPVDLDDKWDGTNFIDANGEIVVYPVVSVEEPVVIDQGLV